MIGRADIEGSKSNVAMNAWLPQASYPCGNFSDTLSSNSEDVPPQPNSPPDNVFRPDRPTEGGLVSKKRGVDPLPIHGIRTPVPSPQSQSFSRGYGSILPTSLAYIVPLTRGCSPWRPDAVMSTTRHGRHSVLRIFKGLVVHSQTTRLADSASWLFCYAGFDNDPSAGSPTETLLRLLLPLNDKVQWNSRDVAGSEPPTSPRS
ncbi:hypothetical protein R6Q59_035031 [Mikania micrantha]